MTRKGSDYVPSPEVMAADLLRYETTLAVLCGLTSVAKGAETLGLSRVRYQSLVHRAKAAFVDALIPQLPGRPKKPERELELQKQVAQLKRENEQLRQQLEVAEKLFGAAGEMLRGMRREARSPRRQRKSSTEKGSSTEEPEPEKAEPITGDASSRPSSPFSPRWRAEMWRAVIEPRLKWSTGRHLAALLLGVSLCTIRRWRASGEQAPVSRPGPAPVSPEARAQAVEQVRTTGGLIGAEALRQSVPGISRRQAARIKSETRTVLEQERQSRCAQLTVSQPGLIRGFDAMHVATTNGVRYLLVCADGAVPFRTTIAISESYDGAAVEATLAKDIALHEAPLVYRMDRASVHAVPSLRQLLRDQGVLVLQGPPHHPRFYGQLERQNRDHRAWLKTLGLLTPEQLEQEVAHMMHGLNWQWPQRKLEWHTPGDLWNQRPPIVEDRTALRQEVIDRLTTLRTERHLEDQPSTVLERLAIEQTLRAQGIISIQPGERC